VLAEELVLLDADSDLWHPLSSLLDAALRLEQCDDTYFWHGWDKKQIDAFLHGLPDHCTLLLGVWDTSTEETNQLEREVLVLGCVCEVLHKEVCTLRTFEALSGIPPVQELEPGFEHARALIKAAQEQVAPVAWALFTDTVTWNEWLWAEGTDHAVVDKSERLAEFARQGRCVLMGSQTRHRL
jgi:hypothetical protein